MYTGERILPQKIFNVTYQQSLLAYTFTQKLVSGRSVLDVACGDGYGAFLLASTAAEVVGLDYDIPTIERARQQYNRPNLTFTSGDLFNLQKVLGDKKFDVVCCFQTIEHFQDHDEFLRALKTVLEPNGHVVLSTPNRLQFPSFNPYHLHELSADEFSGLLKKHFPIWKIHGVFGDRKVWEYRMTKQKIGNMVLKFDVFKAREWLPRGLVKFIYQFVSHDIIKRLSWLKHQKEITKISAANFSINDHDLDKALDFIGVAQISSESSSS